MSYGMVVRNSSGRVIFDTSNLALLLVDVFFISAGNSGSRNYQYSNLSILIAPVDEAAISQNDDVWQFPTGRPYCNVSGSSVNYGWQDTANGYTMSGCYIYVFVGG